MRVYIDLSFAAVVPNEANFAAEVIELREPTRLHDRPRPERRWFAIKRRHAPGKGLFAVMAGDQDSRRPEVVVELAQRLADSSLKTLVFVEDVQGAQPPLRRRARNCGQFGLPVCAHVVDGLRQFVWSGRESLVTGDRESLELAPHTLADATHRFAGLVVPHANPPNLRSMLHLVGSVKGDAEKHGEGAGSKIDHLHLVFAERRLRLSEHGPGEVDMGDVIAEQVKQRDFVAVVIRHAIAAKLVQRNLGVPNETPKLTFAQAITSAQVLDLGLGDSYHCILQQPKNERGIRHRLHLDRLGDHFFEDFGPPVGRQLAAVAAHLRGQVENADAIEGCLIHAEQPIVCLRRPIMVLKDVDSDAARPITPMSEIRRHKGMRLEEYVELYPVWADWMRNHRQLMYDEDGGAWVPRWNPEHGVAIGWEDDEECTPEAAEALKREARRALEEVRAGGGVDFRELDEDESFWADD